MSGPADRPLGGKVAIVTGASRGIGAATALALSRAGASVVLAAPTEQSLATLADRIRAEHGGRALAVPTDVSDPVSVLRLVEQTLGAYGRLDVAFNNAAGGGHPPTPLAEVSVDDYDSALAAGLRGVFLSMKYEIPAMLKTGGGAIVNMASTAGLEAVAGLAGYVSAKFGVIGLTRTAALDYAHMGIRVNALAPGPIRTEQLESMPAKRIGHPGEVADAVVWLCSDQASFITGATLPIGGGMLAGMPPFNVKPAHM